MSASEGRSFQSLSGSVTILNGETTTNDNALESVSASSVSEMSVGGALLKVQDRTSSPSLSLQSMFINVKINMNEMKLIIKLRCTLQYFPSYLFCPSNNNNALINVPWCALAAYLSCFYKNPPIN